MEKEASRPRLQAMAEAAGEFATSMTEIRGQRCKQTMTTAPQRRSPARQRGAGDVVLCRERRMRGPLSWPSLGCWFGPTKEEDLVVTVEWGLGLECARGYCWRCKGEDSHRDVLTVVS